MAGSRAMRKIINSTYISLDGRTDKTLARAA
jgi:hypothetical protein